MTPLDLLLGILCAYRLTQLLVYDAILEPVTSWLANLHPKLDEMLCCPHCCGFWCAVATVLMLWGAGHWSPLRYVLWAFALAGAVSLVEHATQWLAPKAEPEQDILSQRHTPRAGGEPADPMAQFVAMGTRWQGDNPTQKGNS